MDDRYEYPVEFVRQNVLGCLEASKACCIVPGKRHLFHAEFIARSMEHISELDDCSPLDHFLEIKYAHCPEVSWYLHLQTEAAKRQELPTQEALPEVEALVEGKPILKMWGCGPMWKNTEDKIVPMTPEMRERFNKRVTNFVDAKRAMERRCPTPGCTFGSAETGRVCSKLPHTSLLPEILEGTVADTIGDSRRGDPYTTGATKGNL